MLAVEELYAITMSEESCCRLYTVYTVYLNVFAASCFACYKPKIIYLFFCLIMDFKQIRNQPLAVMCLKMILIKKKKTMLMRSL